MFGERQHNYPPGYEESPQCPNGVLVVICNSLAGLTTIPETFCTEEMTKAHFSEGVVHHLKSADFHPRASCAISNRMLRDQLTVVNNKVVLPPEDDTISQIDKAKTIGEKDEIIRSYKEIKQKHDLRESIIERWRKVIFESCCSTTQDEPNPHFRRFNSADELTKDEVVEKVKQFSQKLEEIVGFSRQSIAAGLSNEAENCRQSPFYHRF